MLTRVHENKALDVSVIVPVYNEGNVIEELYARLKRVLDDTGKEYEIIFVDDGSTDQTFKKLKEIQDTDARIKLIKLRGNFGQTAGLAAGFDNATGDVLLAMDGDLQHFPEDIPKFIEKMDEGYDIVESSLPVLLTAVKELNQPRMPSLKGKMAAKKAAIIKMGKTEIDADENNLGLKGSPTQVKNIFAPQIKAERKIIEGAPEKQVNELIAELRNIKCI